MWCDERERLPLLMSAGGLGAEGHDRAGERRTERTAHALLKQVQGRAQARVGPDHAGVTAAGDVAHVLREICLARPLGEVDSSI